MNWINLISGSRERYFILEFVVFQLHFVIHFKLIWTIYRHPVFCIQLFKSLLVTGSVALAQWQTRYFHCPYFPDNPYYHWPGLSLGCHGRNTFSSCHTALSPVDFTTTFISIFITGFLRLKALDATCTKYLVPVWKFISNNSKLF